MKQKRMKYVVVILCLSLSLSIFSAYAAQSETKDTEASKKSIDSVGLYGLYLSVEEAMQAESIAYGANNTYADDYGGCYIENGELVVCLTNPQSSTSKSLIQNHEVAIQEVTWSYNYLDAVEHLILDKYSQEYINFQNDPNSPEFELLNAIQGTAFHSLDESRSDR